MISSASSTVALRRIIFTFTRCYSKQSQIVVWPITSTTKGNYINDNTGIYTLTNRPHFCLYHRGFATKVSEQTDCPKGKVFEKFPVKVTLEAGKLYAWCTCGTSAKQPFCDGSHKKLNEASGDKSVVFKPHRFQVEQMKEYVVCQCKQTNKRPFCDGTHKSLK